MIKAAVLYFTISAITSHSDTLLQAARVTALKEVVSLDKVASPLTAMQPKDGTNRPNSLSGIVPGLHIPEYGASLTSTVYLRGLGSRMDNPVMGLYIDGIPVLEKNAYDFDLAGVESAIFMGGPQGTVYGRNSMGGVLSMMTYSPGLGSSIFAEYGTANSLRTGGRISFGNNVISASYRHTDGFFTNGYKGSPADPYDGGTLLWRHEKTHSDGLKTLHTAPTPAEKSPTTTRVPTGASPSWTASEPPPQGRKRGWTHRPPFSFLPMTCSWTRTTRRRAFSPSSRSS